MKRRNPTIRNLHYQMDIPAWLIYLIHYFTFSFLSIFKWILHEKTVSLPAQESEGMEKHVLSISIQCEWSNSNTAHYCKCAKQKKICITYALDYIILLCSLNNLDNIIFLFYKILILTPKLIFACRHYGPNWEALLQQYTKPAVVDNNVNW